MGVSQYQDVNHVAPGSRGGVCSAQRMGEAFLTDFQGAMGLGCVKGSLWQNVLVLAMGEDPSG